MPRVRLQAVRRTIWLIISQPSISLITAGHLGTKDPRSFHISQLLRRISILPSLAIVATDFS